MTTILKALEELQRQGAPGARHPDPWTGRRRQPRWRLLAAALLALTGSVAGVLFFLRGRDTQPPNASQSAAPPVQSQPMPAPVPPVHAVPAAEERPWAVVGTKRAEGPAARVASAPSSEKNAGEGQSERTRVQAPANGEVAQQPRKPQIAIAEKPAPVGDQPRGAKPYRAPRQGGDARIEVKSILYSPEAAQRMVTLRIDDANLVTLHEGDSISGVEVQLILSNSVYLRRGGSVFAVGATP